MSEVDSLASAIQSRKGVVIVGAGASVSTTKNQAVASWVGLIRWSIEFLRKNGQVSEEVLSLQELSLETYLNQESSTQGLIGIAGTLRGLIKENGENADANWLRQSIGSLTVEDDSWPLAIGRLKLPILTTNYDSLLEETLGRRSADWTEQNVLQEIVGGDSKDEFIGHLHGHWKKPNSVIFSNEDYLRLKQHDQTQAINKSTAALKSMIYIGFGEGLQDPTFTQLLSWHRETFPGTSIRHFRLCLERDVDKLRAQHIDDAIDVVSYGTSYEDLPGFLENIRPAEPETGEIKGLDPVFSAHQALTEQLRNSTIIGELVGDVPNSDIDDLVLPPILLPLPHDEFVQQHMNSDTKKERLDPYEVAKDKGITLIVGDEQTGLTTTLQWLLTEATHQNPTRVPLYVDFRTCARDAQKPLSSALKNEAALLGVIAGRRSELPNCLAAIDNITGGRRQLLERSIPEISQGSLGETVFLGARSGEETELLRLFDEVDISVRVMYVGRLSNTDVRRFVKLAEPRRTEAISSSVLDALREQRLPRTPFTIALLISIFVNGKDISANTSPTAVLDQYVSLLLGRGDADEDSRFGFDSVQREAMLQDIARLFLEQQRGALQRSMLLSRLENFFETYGWTEDASPALDSFIERRILRADGNYIRFSQESYLHLFLAKAALDEESSESGLAELGMLEDALRYSPVIRHFAALSRKNSQLLHHVQGLISEWTEDSKTGTAYRVLESELSPDEHSEHDRNINIGKRSRHGTEYDIEEMVLNSPSNIPISEIPFPLQPMDDLPKFIKFSFTLDLVSSVLRDSDRVSNLVLKQDLLREVLKGWGRFNDFMTFDNETQESFNAVAESISDALEIPQEKRVELTERFRDNFPPYFTLSGISSSLASRKLNAILNSLMRRQDLFHDIETAVPIAMLISELRESDWADQVQRVLAEHKKYWIVNVFLRQHFESIYINYPLPADSKQAIGKYISSLASESYRFSTIIDRKNWEGKHHQTLEQRRLNATGRPAIETD